ncbi:MAG TPA: methyltransferase domain-containing protein [Actinomycetota bacterium]
MPIFRRNHTGGTPAAGPGGAPSATAPTPSGEGDWRAYGSVAQEYQRLFGTRFDAPAKDLADLASIEAGSRVLDVGAGTGILTREVAGRLDGGRVIGIDRSPGMLAVAMGLGTSARYAAADVIDLPFGDATFDRLVSQFVMHHFTKYQTALFDMLRVLTSGGRMALTTWARNEDDLSAAWQEVAEEFAEREILASARESISPWEELCADPERLKGVLHDAGLRDIWIQKREYRFEYTREEYLASREVTPGGRFLRQMLGDEFWPSLQRRAADVFAERFPPSFNDFRYVIQAVGHKP